jgi:hypothetical protein
LARNQKSGRLWFSWQASEVDVGEVNVGVRVGEMGGGGTMLLLSIFEQGTLPCIHYCLLI